MKDAPITDILRHVRFLQPMDGPAKVVGIFRAAQMHALPVVQNGRVVGLVTEQSVLSRVATDSEDHITVLDMMERNPPLANVYMMVGQAADMMNTTGAEVLPVIDEFGGYRGVVTRSDVLGAVLDVIRPPMVAGMATPLGVHLTTGSVSAGAGNLGLYLAGVALMLMMLASQALLWAIALGVDALAGTHLTALILSPSTGRAAVIDILPNVFPFLGVVLWMIMLRLSPMSSYHAAEHQVVHAIEAGEPLTPEVVERMPRAHPRCGTNLMAAAVMFTVVAGWLGAQFGVLIAILVVILGWRTVGYYLQQYVTTKHASQRYIQNGIKVGEELLAKYRREPNKPADAMTRIWNMGIPQVALGFGTVLAVSGWLAKLIGLPAWF